MSLDALNRAAEPEARDALTACCGTPRWVAHMLQQRPFASREALFRASDEAWRTFTQRDLLVAFIHHPRIGETGTTPSDGTRAGAWSAREQSGAHDADDGLRKELARANVEYERRFAHRFILYATGKSAHDMLSALRARLANDAEAELAVASEELRKITMLRLDKLLLEGSVRDP